MGESVTTSLVDVSIRYGSVLAVDAVTAEFPRGAVGLLGRNGAGKSSILKALLGLVRPSAGELRILDLSPRASGAEIRRRVGYMPEKDCHIAGLNGFETVALCGRLTGLSPLDAARRAHESLYWVGLDEQRYRPVSGYSAGMKQKVKLAAALAHDPELLFLDEPTNGLDPRGRTEMLALIARLARDLGKSVVLSSHILQDVETVCDSVVLLERGKVIASGPLEELTQGGERADRREATGDAERVGDSLRRHGVLAVEPGEAIGRYRLQVAADTPARVVFAAVRDAGGAVLELVEHRRTLEEVFLVAVQAAEAS